MILLKKRKLQASRYYKIKYLSKKVNIKDVTDKLKGTYFSLANSGILLQETLHPLTCITIYKSVVMPKALYGCEYIYNITESEMVTLERSHRFCIKGMQSLGMHTRTDRCYPQFDGYISIRNRD